MPPADPTPPADDFPAGQTGDMREVLLSPSTGAKPATAASGRWEPPSAQELAAMLPQYEIESMLGRGGMGAVYKGTQIALDRPVAIKILSNQLEDADASFAERFKNEAKAMAKLSHPGIVGVYDFGETAGGLLYIVMEFVEGTDVAKMLSQQKRLHTEHAMAITAHVCDALAYAHERGIIHRDIKPANIMVGYDGVVKVADFGLAKMTHSQNSGLTQSGMAMGTLHYMAPEALMLGAGVDHRADIYAVGVMLYQMLTGKIPQGLFELPSLQVPGLDPRYDGIIGKALREDRELRYPSVLAMSHDLDAILTQPVVKVEAAAAKAPAALQTQARPQRPGGQPYRPPQPEVIVRTEKNGSPLLWVALIAMSGIAGWLLFKDTGKVSEKPPTTLVPATPPEAKAEPPTPSPKGSGKVSAQPPSAFVPATPPAVKVTPPTIRPTVEATPVLSGEFTGVTKDKPFVNSLGMKFVPVPGTVVMMCIHETRRGDYAPFANEVSVDKLWVSQKVQVKGTTQIVIPSDDHPVVHVSWADADAFCSWLGKKEGRTYRLPTDREWSASIGIANRESAAASPSVLDMKLAGVFPWGDAMPPPPEFENFADSFVIGKVSDATPITGYTDGWAHTAPVMTFAPNALGFYDLAGNVREWCADWMDGARKERVVRGSCWKTSTPDWLLSSRRIGTRPVAHYSNYGFRCVLEVAIPQPKVTLPPVAQTTTTQLATPALPTGPTTWTDTKGRSITATFKAVASGNVLLDIAGKMTPVPLNTLSAASQKLARDYQAALEAGAAKAAAQPSKIPADTFAYGTSRYAYFAEAINWEMAKSKAESLGGHLVTLNTQAEEASVAAQVRARFGTGITNFWIGGILDAPAGSWRWITGEAFTYTHWDIKEPNNANAADQRSTPPFVVACHLNRESHIGWRDYSVSHPNWQSTITGYLVEWDNVRPASQPAHAAPSAAAASSLVKPASATKDAPFVNSLGMKFVPVPGTKVLMCIHETRNQDYAAYAASNPTVNGKWSGAKQDAGLPVAFVNWHEATAFCEWLTQKEGVKHRLPTDREWSFAIGIGSLEDDRSSPEALGKLNQDIYPWGKTWPPPNNSGNYWDAKINDLSVRAGVQASYADGFNARSPVMSFPANSLGIHDLAGNVLEWCEDWHNEQKNKKALRGISIVTGMTGLSDFSSSRRRNAPPENREDRFAEFGFRCVIELQ
jgi:serine/threonine protein kinase/formylglycine-generating enzyme required for sulfatase activity